MTPIQLYKLVEPDLALLNYTSPTNLCSHDFYILQEGCMNCKAFARYPKLTCLLQLKEPVAKELKHMIFIKHPEFFI